MILNCPSGQQHEGDSRTAGLSLDGRLPPVTGLMASFGVASMSTEAPEPVGQLMLCRPTQSRARALAGDAAPLSNPGLSRRWGSTGPTATLPPDSCTGGPLVEQRTVVVAACTTRREPAAFGSVEALRLPSAEELAREALSGLGYRWPNAFVRVKDHAAA